MKRFAIRSAGSRLLWLLLVTASAVALTNYLFDPNGESMTGGWCFGLFGAAWLTVILAWRWHRPYLRRWSGGLTFLVMIAEILVVSVVRDNLFACPAPPPTPQERQYHALMTAVRNNDLMSVRQILATDGAPDAIVCGKDEDCNDETPLDVAVSSGNRQIAALLFDHGASANGGIYPSPLARAADRNDLPMMGLLIRHGAPINDGGASGSCVFLWDAVQNGNAQKVDYLLKAGANPFTTEASPIDHQAIWTVLHLARYRDNIPIAQRLKQGGATK